MPSTLHPPLGTAAIDALADAIGTAKAGDLLAAVTVAVPSTYAGLSLRRTLGARPGGLVNVGFVSLSRVAELLGAPALAASGHRPSSRALLTEAVRLELRQRPGLFAPVAAHPSTEQRLTRAVEELRACTTAHLDAVASSGRRAAEVVDMARRVRARLADHWYDEHDLAQAATQAVLSGTTDLTDVGHVIAFCLRRLPRGLRGLLDALALAGGATVIIGDTATEPPPVDLIVSAPDPDEEVRSTIRLVVERLERHPAVPLHRMAMLFPVAEPYTRIAHQQLAAAGIPANGPGVHRLGQTLAGRTLLGLLGLTDGGWRRDDVIALLASAPILEQEHGAEVPAGEWDAVSRRAGVVRGAQQWQSRLTGYIAVLSEQRGPDTGRVDPKRQARLDHDIEQAERLRLFMEAVVPAVDPGDRSSWPDFSAWATALLERYLGSDAHHGRWPEAEQDGWRAVGEALQRLGALDALGGRCDLEVFRRSVELELEAPAGRIGRFGHGLLVAPLSAAAGLDLDTVFVMGLAEGALPAVGGADSLLPESSRQAAGGELAGRETRLEDQHYALHAALAAGRERVLSWPRAELRRGRAALPSRWLVEARSASAPTLLEVDSFEHGMRSAASPASLTDRDLADILGWTASGGAVTDHHLGRELPRLLRGWGVLADRASDRFTRFDGNLTGDRFEGWRPGEVLSPTSLEQYATCPMRYFLKRVLHLGAVERPEEIISITPLDKGTLVHHALEQYTDTVLAGEPRSFERLEAIAEDAFDQLEAAGLAGKPLLWRYERDRMRRELRRFYDTDTLTPLATELAFGLDGWAPVELTLPSGRRVGFRGRADRVDDDGAGGLVVTDYKTGRGRAYERLKTDPVDRGQHVQLPLYGLAAQQRFGTDRPVQARYLMVSETAVVGEVPVTVTDDVLARFGAVVEVVVGGIEAGRFPARPGELGWKGTWDNCTYCEFDSLCQESRDNQWAGKSSATPELVAYVTLAEGSVDDA